MERLRLESRESSGSGEASMGRTTIGILAGFGLLALAGRAPALELLPNGKFDTGIETWSSCCGPTGTVAFDASRDASGSTRSGSAKLVHTQASGATPTSLFLTRCISGSGIQPGKALFFGAKVRFETGNTGTGYAMVSVEFRADVACESATLSGAADSVASTDVPAATWVALGVGDKKAGVVAPPGAQSARIYVVVGKAGSGTLAASFDDVFAAPVGTPVCDGMPATIVGTAQADFLPGTAGSDVIVGRGGGDWIDGKGGNDRLCGGPGDDIVYGGLGDDRVFGDTGHDQVYGGANDDLVVGGGGDDHLFGGSGVDTLKGGGGNDACDGGAGAVDLASGCESTVAVP
jgi:Ca2+-binding RTX toxin-like protein